MSAIVYQTNKKTGIKYVYESQSYWDKELEAIYSVRDFNLRFFSQIAGSTILRFSSA